MERNFNPCVVEILGAYWGDEGKGRAAFFESQDAHLVLRTTGGDNAGHTVYFKGEKIPLHLIPSGIIWPQTTAVICNGVVINPVILYEEIQMLSKYVDITPEKLLISGSANMILPYHIDLDGIQERKRGNQKIGTTNRGIGPCYSFKSDRFSLRMHDVFRDEKDLIELIKLNLKNREEEFRKAGLTYSVEEIYEYCMEAKRNLGKFIGNPDLVLWPAIRDGKKVVIEGAQADRLDLEVGDSPYCTSSYCNPSGTLSGAGIGPKFANKIIATVKAYCSRVGNGPFPTIQNNDAGDTIRRLGHEYGTTTGRPRDCGYLDLVPINPLRGYTDLCLNHLDTIGLIGKEIGCIYICTAYIYQGEKITYYPDDISVTKEIPTPLYEKTFNGGWEIPEGCKSFEDLPKKAQEFVEFIEEFTQTPVSIIGIGPRNEDTIIR
ncbi:MAG: adenylosuccinate synthetase [Clostridia bacterium]|nr:adenylosuccinate synthetase [Clostridia bacterium]